MHLVRIIVGWLLSPRRLLALAGVCMAAGLLWAYATVQENADRALALRQGPPAPVAVEDYRRIAHRSPAGEVVLRAAADPSRRIVLTMPGTGDRRLAVPLYPLAGGEGALGAILLPLAPEEGLPPAEALAEILSDGVVQVTGRAVDPGDFPLILAGALAVEGRWVGDRFVAVQPYPEGREAALQPVTDRSRQWLWPIGLGVLLALLAGWRRFLPGARLLPQRAPKIAGAPPSTRTMASAHFAPLPLQEDVAESGGPTAADRLRAGALVTLRAATAAVRLLVRGIAGLLRLVWAGVEEIRSSR